MALTGDKIGIPEAEEAPVIMMPRWKQPIAGIIAMIYTFAISIAIWWLPMLVGLTYDSAVFQWSLLGGFGLMAVLFAIWFENWPAYKMDKAWKVGLLGTIINIVTTLVLYFLISTLAVVFYPGDLEAGFGILGAFSGSLFAFGVVFVAATMYWPWFDKKQPGRGVRVFIVGWIVTLIFWFVLFFPTYDGVTFNAIAYGINLAWTQWTIFFALLTLMVFEYWPWNKFGKQPKIGIVAFIVCVVLGLVTVYLMAFVLVPLTALPIAAFLGFTGDPLVGLGYFNISYADWLIVAVIDVALFMDNWPKGYSQNKNFLIRLILVMVLGTVYFWAYYYISPILGAAGLVYENLPTAFIILMLYIQLLFAYVWRKWPLNKPME